MPAQLRGQAMAEYIIVFPIMPLLFGTLQFALLYHAKVQMQAIVRMQSPPIQITP